jgi:hypothetical protein
MTEDGSLGCRSSSIELGAGRYQVRRYIRGMASSESNSLGARHIMKKPEQLGRGSLRIHARVDILAEEEQPRDNPALQ